MSKPTETSTGVQVAGTIVVGLVAIISISAIFVWAAVPRDDKNKHIDDGGQPEVLEKLASPTVEVSVINSHEIRVKWNSISNASNYDLQWTTDSAFTSGVGTVISAATWSHITELNANTTYYVRVKAKGTGQYRNSDYYSGPVFSDSDYSDVQSATTPGLKLETPKIIEVSATGSNAMSVTWYPVSNADNYEIQFATDLIFTRDVTTIKSTTTSQDITGLNPNTIYYVHVKAKGTGCIDSDYSPLKSVTRPAEKLDSPTVKVSAISSSEISVTWNSISNAGSFEIQFATNARFTADVGTVQSTATWGDNITELITELNPNTTYYVRVKAIGNGQGSDSDFSPPQSVTTAKPKLETPKIVDGRWGRNKIEVVLTTVSNADRYYIDYTTDEDFNSGIRTVSVNSPSDNSPTTSREITGLNANTTYHVRVKASGAGFIDSDYSKTIWFQTQR